MNNNVENNNEYINNNIENEDLIIHEINFQNNQYNKCISFKNLIYWLFLFIMTILGINFFGKNIKIMFVVGLNWIFHILIKGKNFFYEN